MAKQKDSDPDSDIDLAKKIKRDIFCALLMIDRISVSPEQRVLLNELVRAKNAVASLMTVLGDKHAYDKDK